MIDDLIISYKNYKFKKIISNYDIKIRIKKLAKNINLEYIGKTPLVIGILNGSIYFMMDMLKEFRFNYEIDFIKIKSYKEVKINKSNLIYKNNLDIKNKDIIIFEDIIDTGQTMNLLLNTLKYQEPKSIKIVTLLKKQTYKQFDERKISWYGFIIKDKYVIGYGLDINNLFRNLKDIYIQDEKKK